MEKRWYDLAKLKGIPKEKALKAGGRPVKFGFQGFTRSCPGGAGLMTRSLSGRLFMVFVIFL